MQQNGTRVTAISLRRRPDRWAACDAHLSEVLAPPLSDALDLFEGTDAAAACRGAAPGEAQVTALEAAADCTVYRGWPITEVDDVRRCYPALSDPAAVGDAEAWIRYERSCHAAWRPDRCRLYIDFFHRHLTHGDVGAALSHLRVAERAHAEGLALQVVLEDDVRLTPRAMPELLREVNALGAAGVAWDLIYLHSSHYGRRPELAVHPSSSLRHAGHRKVCHAYALSRSGAAKLARSGFRASVFPVDDFLPCLHGDGHPRDDLMALPCVRAARGEAEAGLQASATSFSCRRLLTTAPLSSLQAGVQAEAGASGPGFVALTFPDDAGLVVSAPRAAFASPAAGSAAATPAQQDSDSKAGHGSNVTFTAGTPQLGRSAKSTPALTRDRFCLVTPDATRVSRAALADLGLSRVRRPPPTSRTTPRPPPPPPPPPPPCSRRRYS
jgi:hypothetical protein